MAKAVGFEGSNTVFRAPEGVSQEDCYDLPAFLNSVPGPMGHDVISCWRLSAEELAEVARTGVVWLQVCGGQPPVAISGTALVHVDGKPARAEPVMPMAPRSGG